MSGKEYETDSNQIRCVNLKRKRIMSSKRSAPLVNKLCSTVTDNNRNCSWNGSMTTIEDISDDDLLIIFSFLNFKQLFYITSVCKRWRILIRWNFSQKSSLSFVNNTRNLLSWKEDNWYEVIKTPKDFTRVHFDNDSNLMVNIIGCCPKIRNLDMECYDLNIKTVQSIAYNCPKLERINFDSSDGFDLEFAHYLAIGFRELKYLNLSCCSYISEAFVQRILESVPNLIALNVCGSQITGICLSSLGQRLVHLNISYCWKLEAAGLMSLTRAKCGNLRELSINNFNFEESLVNESLETLFNTFRGLKHLDMNLGPCTAFDFYLNTLNIRAFSAIAQLNQLEILIIRKICILDDTSLVAILHGCRTLKQLVIDMYSESQVTDISISLVPQFCSSLEILEISNNRDITGEAVNQVIRRLTKLRILVLRFMNIRNRVVDIAVSNCPKLKHICVNGCRRITRQSLLAFIRNSNSKPLQKFEFQAIGTTIKSSFILKGNQIKIKNIPNNIVFKVSHWRSKTIIWYESGQFTYSPKPETI